MRLVHTPTGRLRLRLFNPATGEVVEDRWEQNLVTTGGRTLLAELLTGVTLGIAKVELAVGGTRVPAEPTDNPPAPYPTAADPSNTELYAELLRVPTDLGGITEVPTSEVDTTPRATTAISAVLPTNLSGPVLTLREAGLVITKLVASPDPESEDPSEGEVLYNHVVFGGPITKNPELQMTLTWEVMF
ncbi:hypothetical protein PPSIR1_14760 [Plesiocystis pacifica SIR-1]|uniref:Uncharacterized protein n=1 Tax=Plesiocystis pacifica SIR-1 TaxID=391625 RepID=A6GIT2_9BACT|nr:hypothetical protein [Plesiocystis pacifica]EDM74227.1 hypothetical protein PPSIR1_14760 [Plesiocystis pacifica SIR-1]